MRRPFLAVVTFVAFTNYVGGGFAIGTSLYEDPECPPFNGDLWLSLGAGAFWPAVVAAKVFLEAPGPCERKP